jgi:hypothetical protein
MLTGVIFLVVTVDCNDSHTENIRDAAPDPMVASRARTRDRLAARLRARRLDLALAAGDAPERSAALAERARWQTALPHRRTIANSLSGLIQDADQSRVRSRFVARPSPAHILAAENELRGLADKLGRPGPVAARGAAEAWLLVTDGTGPLYNPARRAQLCACALRAREDLRTAS